MVLLLTCSVADTYAAPAYRTTCSAAYCDGNPLYGPRSLPNAGPIGQMLEGYRRFAGMMPGAYVRKWYVPASPPPTPPLAAGWKYPPLGGYPLTVAGRPVKMVVTLFSGMEVDVFGTERGRGAGISRLRERRTQIERFRRRRSTIRRTRPTAIT